MTITGQIYYQNSRNIVSKNLRTNETRVFVILKKRPSSAVACYGGWTSD